MAASRRAVWLRVLAIVGVVVAAVVVIVGLRVMSDDDGPAAAPPVPCPDLSTGGGAVNPSQAFSLEAATLCHYPAGAGQQPPREGPVPSDDLEKLSADLIARTESRPLSSAPGLGTGSGNGATWLLVGRTTDGERIQLRAATYPSEFAWDGLGPGLVWYPSQQAQQLLESALPG